MLQKDANYQLREAYDTVMQQHALSPTQRDTQAYANALHEMSKAWGHLAWASDCPKGAWMKLLKASCEWIHKLSSLTSLIANGKSLDEATQQFINGCINTVDTYLKTGLIPVIYSLITLTSENGVKYHKCERLSLITQKMTGFPSPILPCYFPSEEPLSENEETVRKYVSKHVCHNEQTIQKIMDSWRTNELPIIQWINQHRQQLNKPYSKEAST